MARNDGPQETRTFESSYDTETSELGANPGEIRQLYWDAVLGLRTEYRDYWLNHAYLHGHQWLRWSEQAGRLDELPDNPERVQATVNRLWPNTRTIISNLMQRELQFEVPPSAADDSHMRGARLAETIARAIHHDHNWEELRENLYYAVWKGGTAALTLDWDPEGADCLSDDAPGAPDTGGATYEEHLNITQFCVEPGTRYPEKARWWIKSVALPPEEVQSMFPEEFPDEPPPADATAGLAPFHRKLMSYDRGGDTEIVDLTTVITYYERPNSLRPEGLVVTLVDNKIVFEAEWPFPFKDRLNLVIVRETLRENRWTGDTVLTAARPIQTLLNVSWSSIIEHQKQAGNARLMVPLSSIEIMKNASDLPGEILPYNDSLPVKPSYLAPPSMPDWWVHLPDRLGEQMDDQVGVHAISRGDAPVNIESGFGLTVLAEKDNTPANRLIKETSGAFGRFMSLVLAVYEDKANDTKIKRRSLVRIPGNAPIDVTWNGDDLKGQTTALVPLDAIMPRSRAAQMEFAKDMLQTYGPEQIDPASFIAIADMPGARDVLAITSPDVDQARRENASFGLGRQSIPREFHDHKVHIAEHNRYRKTVDYELLSEEDKQMIEDHIKAHETMAAGEIGNARSRSNIDPALGMAPTANEGPIVEPLPPPAAPPGQPGMNGLPLPAQAALGAEPPIDPENAVQSIEALLGQMGGPGV